MTKQNYVLEAVHVTKRFRRSFFSAKTKEVLLDINLHLEQGRTVGLLGSSGCGKSTFAKIANGMLRPEQGQVSVMGQNPFELDKKKLAKTVQMIFQQPEESFDPEMQIGKSILEPMQLHGIGTEAERKQKRAELMECMNLSEQLLTRYPHQISGGEVQRLAIVRALTLEPQILILDEPTSMLDVSTQAQILNILKDLQSQRNLSYLFITHDSGAARWMCDEIAVMDQGHIIEYGEAESLFQNPQQEWTRKLLYAWDE